MGPDGLWGGGGGEPASVGVIVCVCVCKRSDNYLEKARISGLLLPAGLPLVNSSLFRFLTFSL